MIRLEDLKLYYYLLFGNIIESDIDFPQLVKTKEAKADIMIRAGQMPQELYDYEQDCGSKFGDDISWLINTYCYLYVENGKTITYDLKEAGTLSMVRSYLMGWGMSLLGLQRGMNAMHCSVVAMDKGAILISGESGSGKSTLTNMFLDKGWKFMADDMAYVQTKDDGEPVVYPAFPYQKLCRDAALRKGYDLEELIYLGEDKDKFFVPYKGEFVMHEMPIKALIVLGRYKGDEVVTEELSGLNKFMACVNNLFLRNLLGQARYAGTPAKESFRMAEGIKVFRITRPVEGDTLQEVTQKAMALAEDIMKDR